MEKKVNNTIKSIFFISYALLIIYFFYVNCTGEGKGNYNYTTQVIKSDKDYDEEINKLLCEIEDLRNTPPKKVIKYKVKDSISIIYQIPDSLVVYIEKLKDSIKIHKDYIRNYPRANKLITFELGKDNINLGLLSIDGNLTKQFYPLYLDQYNYIYEDNILKHFPKENKLTLTPKRNIDFTNLHLMFGYDFFIKDPYTSINYSLDMGRFRFNSELGLTINKSPSMAYKVLFGYRLLK